MAATVSRPITACGPADADPRQPGGGLVQRLEREVDARGDDAAQIGAIPSTTSKVVAVPKSMTTSGPL